MDYRSLSEEFAATDRLGRAAAGRHLGEPRRTARQSMTGLGLQLARTAIVITLLITAVATLISLPIAWYQVDLIYWASVDKIRPDQLPEGTVQKIYASDSNADYEAYVHKGKPNMPVAIYLHGRGESLWIAQLSTASYEERGWTTIIPEYPGFAGLRGRPSEKSISRLMDLVYDDVAAQHIPVDHIVIHGNSLGAGPAMMLAQYPHAVLLLTAPVARFSEVMHHWVPFVPTLFLMDRWDNVGRAGTAYPSPTVVVQARDDGVVPIDQGRAMAKATKGRMVELAEGGHGVGYNSMNLHYTGNGQFDYDGRSLGTLRQRHRLS